MRADNRWLVTFAGNLVFLFLVGQLNHALSDTPFFGLARGQLSLFLLGLPLAFLALRLGLVPAVAATVVTAVAVEANVPVPPGLIVLPATACVCITIALRAHFNRFETTTALFAGLLINLVLMLVLTGAALREGASGIALGRVALDLVASQLALAALTTWFFAAQTALLELFGFHLDTELREPL